MQRPTSANWDEDWALSLEFWERSVLIVDFFCSDKLTITGRVARVTGKIAMAAFKADRRCLNMKSRETRTDCVYFQMIGLRWRRWNFKDSQQFVDRSSAHYLHVANLMEFSTQKDLE